MIGLANAGNDTINAIKQAGNSVSSQGQSLAALIFFLQDVHSLGLNVTQGTYRPRPPTGTRRAFPRLVQGFLERAGMMPSMLHAGVYGAVLHYLKAIKAGTDDPDKVSAAMRAMPINDAFTKEARFAPTAVCCGTMYLARVKKPADSKGPLGLFRNCPHDRARRHRVAAV